MFPGLEPSAPVPIGALHTHAHTYQPSEAGEEPSGKKFPQSCALIFLYSISSEDCLNCNYSRDTVTMENSWHSCQSEARSGWYHNHVYQLLHKFILAMLIHMNWSRMKEAKSFKKNRFGGRRRQVPIKGYLMLAYENLSLAINIKKFEREFLA